MSYIVNMNIKETSIHVIIIITVKYNIPISSYLDITI